MLNVTTNKEVISTGIKEISEQLDGGIRPGSLMFIEGQSETGKSILAQHLAYGALSSGDNLVAYYTTEHSVRSLIAQMDSLSLSPLEHFLADRFRIYPLTVRNCYGETQKYLTKILMSHLQELPERFNLVIVDSVTPFLTHVKLLPTLDFFQDCREMCKQGRSLVLVANSHAFKKDIVSRAYDLSSDYIKLASEEALLGSDQIDERVIKVMDVPKLRGAERPGRDSLRFEIRPGTGIHVLPFTRVRI